MSDELKNKLILVIANEPWGDIWYSKHNYAYELSKTNTVVFINPTSPWKITNTFKNPVLHTIERNLYTLNYFNYFPLVNKLVSKFNNYLCSKKLNNFLKLHFSNPIDVFWTFDPHRLFNPKLFSPNKSIFHVVDLYNGKFFGENSLIKNSDLIIIVSKTFQKYYSDLNKNIIHIPHGISASQFTASEQPALKYDGIYVGNIDERVNFKLLEKILIHFPETIFLFIGKFYSNNDSVGHSLFIEKKYTNLVWLGAKPFNELKNYISNAKFCLSIMNSDHPGNDIAHHKTLQYLAFGKPIFGSIFKDYSEISDLIYQNNNDSALIELMSIFLLKNENSDLIAKRIDFARQFTYDKHILTIENALNALQK